MGSFKPAEPHSQMRCLSSIFFVSAGRIQYSFDLDHLFVVIHRWLSSHQGSRARKKPPPCQEFLTFVNVTKVGKADLCQNPTTDTEGMIHNSDGS